MSRRSSLVDALPEALAASIDGVLGDELVGIYLFGSVVSGGFDPGVSDLDLVVVATIEADELDLIGLDRVHREFIGEHPDWTDRIEVVYIGKAALESFRTSTGRLAVISPGEPFHLRDDRPIAWLQNWYLIRETGIALLGPPAAAVVPSIDWAESVAASRHYADDISRRSRGDTNPGSLAYSVLTLCRVLMSTEAQTNASKQAAAAWTQERMPEWAWLIDAALRCRISRGTIGCDDAPSQAAARTFIAQLAAEIRPA